MLYLILLLASYYQMVEKAYLYLLKTENYFATNTMAKYAMYTWYDGIPPFFGMHWHVTTNLLQLMYYNIGKCKWRALAKRY